VFLAEDGKRGAPAVAIVSRRPMAGVFGADSNLIGSSINLDKRSFTVVGIMRGNFGFHK